MVELNDFSKKLLEHNDYDTPKFLIQTHEKCIIFHGPKLCSSTISKANGYASLNFDITFDKSTFSIELSNLSKKSELSTEQLISYETIIKDIEAIKSDTIKKDIIILYREPWQRFVSAFSQDYIKQFISDINNQISHNGVINPFLSTWFDSKGISNSDRREVLGFINENKSFHKISNKLIPIRNQIITLLVSDSLINSNIFTGHHKPYLPIISNFISRLSRSKSKVKLLDIDLINVSNYLSKYDSVYKSIEYINKSTELNNIVNIEIIKQMSQSTYIRQKILSSLYYEQNYYYEMLFNHSELIYNPIT